jgi:carboxypeptidase T
VHSTRVRRVTKPVVAVIAAVLAMGLAQLPAGGVSAAASLQMRELHNYRIDGVTTKEQRTAIQRTGLSIEGVGANYVLARGYANEAAKVQSAGFAVSYYYEPADFPPGYEGYHNYKEINDDIAAEVAKHPTTVKSFTIGKTYQGMDIPAVLITNDAPNYTSGRPEVLFDGLHHAREHLTVEMTLYIMHLFADAKKQSIKKLVNTRAIWIIFNVNPDGGEYDISNDQFHYWRKNRQPNQGGSIGTDLNRNYGYKWGCCGGSSGNGADETYRGTKAFSAPESKALADFVKSRIVGGKQQITAGISFHTYGELVMWPYGYTYTDVPSDMTQKDHDTFVKIGQVMANDTCLNGDCYFPQQMSDLYITDGTSVDWEYGDQHIFAFTIEMYGDDFYVPDTVIKTQTRRMKGAVLYLTKLADCVYKAIGKGC